MHDTVRRSYKPTTPDCSAPQLSQALPLSQSVPSTSTSPSFPFALVRLFSLDFVILSPADPSQPAKILMSRRSTSRFFPEQSHEHLEWKVVVLSLANGQSVRGPGSRRPYLRLSAVFPSLAESKAGVWFVMRTESGSGRGRVRDATRVVKNTVRNRAEGRPSGTRLVRGGSSCRSVLLPVCC